jgi:hypothetical protein
VLRWLHSSLCLQNRHAGYSFRSLFHNRLDSHLYLGSKGWPATSTSTWLRPPLSEGGVRWIATKLLQRRPCERFCCELLRTSQTCFAQLKARHSGSQRTPMYRFLFSAGLKSRAKSRFRRGEPYLFFKISMVTKSRSRLSSQSLFIRSRQKITCLSCKALSYSILSKDSAVVVSTAQGALLVNSKARHAISNLM